MKAFVHSTTLTVILGGILMALPVASHADKGGKPNKNSVATTAACLEADDTVRVYSCKGISNVVIWCGTTYIKFDDIGKDPDTGEEAEVYEHVLSCGEAEGKISFVAIKSGSQQHKKHDDGYTPPADLPLGAPSGSGLFVDDIPSCPLAAESIPVPGDCDAEPTDPPNEPPTF